MTRRALGATGYLVSPIGLGTVKLGRNQGVKYPGGGGYALPTDEQATDLLRCCVDLGINLIDTAPAYGVSEQRIGELMRKHAWFGGRQRWVLCTKAGEDFDTNTGQSRFDFSESGLRSSLDRSLQRLGVSSVDVLLIHSDGNDEWIIKECGAMTTLAAIKQAGKVGAIGFSGKTVQGGLLAIDAGADVVMVTLNATEQAERAVIVEAESRGVGVLIKKALASGHLGRLKATPVEALKQILMVPGVHSAIVGTSSPAHLKENTTGIL